MTLHVIVETRGCYIIRQEVINQLEGEREKSNNKKWGRAFKRQHHFHGPKINICILFHGTIYFEGVSGWKSEAFTVLTVCPFPAGKIQVKSSDIQVGDLIIVEKVNLTSS